MIPQITDSQMSTIFSSLLASFYMIMLIYSVFMVRYFIRYNNLLPIQKKIDLKVLNSIPLSIIFSYSLSIVLFFLPEESAFFDIGLNIVFVFLTYSAFTFFYMLIYIPYQSRQEISRLTNKKCKWYQDETALYSNIVFILCLFAPIFVMFIMRITGETINELSQPIATLYLGLSFYVFFFLYSLRISRIHFEKVIVGYIETEPAFEILKQETIRYKEFKAEKENKNTMNA